MLKITENYKIWFGISAVLIAASIAAVFAWGLRLGIDFRGGVLWETRFTAAVSSQDIRETIQEAQISEPVIQPVSENQVIIKAKEISEEQKTLLESAFAEKFGGFEELRYESIGPVIGRELLRRAYWQIVLVMLGIILYIAYAFRKIKASGKDINISSWHLGLATIIALAHDLIITVGVFAILGRLKGVEIDNLFITALLTILGFSVHDTIVVFDRIRENLQKYPYKSLSTIIDHSLATTMARSLNTSSTLLFVLLAMLFFGGTTIFYFVLALLVGVSVGVYSSIFIASPLLYLFRPTRR